MLRTKIRPQGDGFSILSISPRLALCYKALKKPGKNGRMDRLQCGYVGFDDKGEALQFAEWLRGKLLPFAPLVRVRESDRLPECAWEVKIAEHDGLLDLFLTLAVREQEQKQEQEQAA